MADPAQEAATADVADATDAPEQSQEASETTEAREGGVEEAEPSDVAQEESVSRAEDDGPAAESSLIQEDDGDDEGDLGGERAAMPGESGGFDAEESYSPRRTDEQTSMLLPQYKTAGNIRGSRPNSALVASIIDGYQDDFNRATHSDDEDGEEWQEGYEGDEGGAGAAGGAAAGVDDDLPSMHQLLAASRRERSKLLEVNEMLQKRVRQAIELRNKGRPPVVRDLGRLDGADSRYRAALKQWADLAAEQERLDAYYQTNSFDLKCTLEQRIKRADEVSKAYRHFLLEVAKGAEHPKSGKPISEKLLAQLDGEDQVREDELQRVRLKHIHLSNQLRRMEQMLRQKEQLADGLHLIDFEQLKIENQGLNEKIEERNEELLRLRKKTTTTVQILTHVREKLLFVEKENAGLGSRLTELNAQSLELRNVLSQTKGKRDALKGKMKQIKDTTMYVTDPKLLQDYDSQRERRYALQQQFNGLQREYDALAVKLSRTVDRINAATEGLAAAQMLDTARSSAHGTPRTTAGLVMSSPRASVQ